MGKYELRRYIQTANTQITDFNNQIAELERKIVVYQKDKIKLMDMYVTMQNSYIKKRADVDLARARAKGTAMTSFIARFDELYGNERWRKAAVSFENMEEVIQNNIWQAQKKIEELKSQIASMENNISGWQNEIRQIERQEKEQQNAKNKSAISRITRKGVK